MKLMLPAVNEPTIRVLVDTNVGIVNLDFNGERPQEVEISLPDVDVATCPIGYVAVGSHGQEVGEPVLLRRPDQCRPPLKSDEAGTTLMGKEVVVAPVEPNGGDIGHPDPANPVPAALNGVEPAEKPVVALAYANEQPAAEAPPETVKVTEQSSVKVGRKK